MRKTSTPGPDRRSPRGREESIPKPPSRKVHFDQLPLGYGRGLPAGNGIGAESGTVAIAASAFACATDAPGTSEFGISLDAPLYVPIWADAAPSPPKTVQSYGAKCDGSSDDTEAIRNALNDVLAHYGELQFPSGACKLR
jgi:hypothetical protein